MTLTLGWSLRVKGRENLPKSGPVLLLANHQSFMDPGAIGSLYNRHVAYLARKTLFDNPAFGFYIRVLNSVPVDQEGVAKEGLKAILAKLDAGWPVMMFPEGARTLDGRMQPMKPGVLLLVKRVKCPIVPIGIVGAFEAWSRMMKYPIPAPLFLPPTKRCVAISFGKPRDPGTLTGLSREQMLATIESDIAAQVAEAEKIRRRR
jgi:1-acyl-sn-glycerol-3-phosphate acyltransferase